MRIAVLGTGGIGGYFGGRLAASGHDVTFVARGAHLEAIRETGLQIASVAGDFTVHPARATDDVTSVGTVDVVLLAVKTWQLPPVLELLPSLIGEGTAVITTQNGVEAPDQVAAVVGRGAVLPGIAKIFAYIDGPGRVTHAGGPASLAFDEWSRGPGAPSERVARLREAVTASGAVSPVPDDIWAELWSKMLFVVPFGGLGAALDATIGELRGVPSVEDCCRTRCARSRPWPAPAVSASRSPWCRAPWPSSTTSPQGPPPRSSATSSRVGRRSSTHGPAPSCGSPPWTGWTHPCTGSCSRSSPGGTPKPLPPEPS